MFQINLTLRSFGFNKQEYIETVMFLLTQKIKYAAGEAYKEIIRRIPAFNSELESERSTGFLAGAFANLRDFAELTIVGPNRSLNGGQALARRRILAANVPPHNFKKTARNVEPRSYQNQRKIFKQGLKYNPKKQKFEPGPVQIRNEYYEGVLKSPISGRHFATAPSDILKVQGTSVFFHFQVDISYLPLQDLGLTEKYRSPYSPWRALERGMQIFNRLLTRRRELQPLFPPPADFFITKSYIVQYGNITKRDEQLNLSKFGKPTNK